MVRSSSYCPQLTALESRLQPGSIFTGIVDTSLLGGSLGLLGQSLLSPVSQVSESARADKPQQLAAADLGSADLFIPVAESTSARSLDSVQARPVVSDDLVHAVLSAVTPVNNGGGHITGGACEDAGNIVVNGDFEAGGDPWFQIGDPYANVAADGGHLTPGFHLRVGAVGSHGLVYQDVQTEADVMYTIRVSVRAGDPDPSTFIAIRWGDDTVADITADITPDYQRFEYVGAVVGTGKMVRFGFEEQQDPDYTHIDDVCVTPSVK